MALCLHKKTVFASLAAKNADTNVIWSKNAFSKFLKLSAAIKLPFITIIRIYIDLNPFCSYKTPILDCPFYSVILKTMTSHRKNVNKLRALLHSRLSAFFETCKILWAKMRLNLIF